MAFLERVEIHNFRNVRCKYLDFNVKNIISGKNMTGKTNTLNAIHWAFTGVTLDGSNDNRANFPLDGDQTTSVKLYFGDFIFQRVCEMEGGKPTITIYIDGDKAPTIKNGEARLHSKLGLSDFVLNYPKFDIIRFLLNPLFFDTLAPKDMRKFLYALSETSFESIKATQSQRVKDVVDSYLTNEPYALLETIDKKKKAIKKALTTCKEARDLFPSIAVESKQLEKDLNEKAARVETEEVLAQKYALAISKKVNAFYQKAMGIKICLLEEGVGDDVYKDVCYPILPKSELPFKVGSYAERAYVGMRFIQEVCLKWNIKPLPILLDNMESLDSNTEFFVDSLGVQYIGAKVME